MLGLKRLLRVRGVNSPLREKGDGPTLSRYRDGPGGLYLLRDPYFGYTSFFLLIRDLGPL